MREVHWLDRLAVATTRRQGFKVVLAAALGTVPLLRSREARAAAQQCTQPCFYSAQVEASHRNNLCDAQLAANGIATATSLFTNPILASASLVKLTADRLGCINDGYEVAKAAQFTCLQPDCGGWQPDPDILCPGCKPAGGKCCPAPSSSSGSGYLCCANCHPSGDGCTA
jgi:hypothetical protein